jgi:NADP-dependent 3-hydroxy acid dehydrogenase YdfG
MQTIQDKIAIVTGASRGIGRATALELAKNGARIVLAARDKSALEQVADDIRALRREVLVVPTDVADQDQVDTMVNETISYWGGVDILVSNAGVYYHATIHELTAALMEKSIKVNFLSHVYAVMAVLPHMMKQSEGHIIFVSSMASKRGVPTDVPYAPAKYALTGFGETIRQELYGTGVNVSTIMPGRVDSDFVKELEFPWVTPKMPPEWVSRAIVKAIIDEQAEVTVLHFQTRILHYANTILKELAPRLADRIAGILHLEGWKVSEKESIKIERKYYERD